MPFGYISCFPLHAPAYAQEDVDAVDTPAEGDDIDDILDATIEELDTLYRDASERLETKDLDMQMRWWMQGAIIAFCGAIAGVIFVFIPRPTRKQKRERY